MSPGIPVSSPFCKGGLRGIFIIQALLIESLPKEGLKLSLLCKGGLRPPAHRAYGSVRGFFNIAQTTDNLFQFLTTILN